jgi:TPR repeat protein
MARLWLVTGLALVLTALVAAEPTASAQGIKRNCPRGEIWEPNNGACARKKVVKKRSPEESYYLAIDLLEGKNGKTDPTKAAGLLAGSCGKRHAESCTLLGFLYRSGRGVAADARASLRSYTSACDLGDPDGCVGAADVHSRGVLGAIDNARAVPFLEKGCAANNGPACYLLGEKYGYALGVEVDVAKAEALYKQAFELVSASCPKQGPACFVLGTAYADGHGAEQDLARAFTAFEQGCTAGSGEACYRVGAAYEAGAGVETSTDRALTTYDRACRQYDHAEACFAAGVTIALGPESGWDKTTLEYYGERACTLDPKNCDLLGHLYGTGKTGNEDQTKAGDHFRVACEHGKAQACYNIAARMTSGTGIAKDEAGAVAFHERACEGRHGPSCLEAGRAYYNGTVVAQSDGRAFELFSDGCLRGDAVSCYNGGWVLANNRWGGTEADPGRGALYHEEGCRLGESDACSALGNLYEAGTGVDKDLAKAIEQWSLGCDGVNGGVADPYGCEKLGRAHFDGVTGTKDLLAAGRAFQRACALGQPNICYWLDQTFRDAGADAATKADALQTLETSCAAATPVDEACLALGDLFARGGYLTEKNGRRAFALYDGVCKRGVAVGCLGLAFAYANGTGVVKNVEKAKEIYGQQCDQGMSQSCTWLGIELGNEGKFADAFALYERACQEGDAIGCNQMGFSHYTSKGASWDVVKANKAYERCCELGNATGCANVAEMHEYGIGRERDLTKARELYERGCTPTDHAACGRVGKFYEKGLGGATVDKARAEEAYKRACDPEPPMPEACHDLARFYESTGGADAPQIALLEQRAFDTAKEASERNPYYTYVLGTYYRDGVATVKSPETAAKLFVESCEGYDPVGCLAAGEIYLGGHGLPANLEIAVAQFHRACAAKVTEGCEQHAAAKARLEGGSGKVDPIAPGAKGCGCGAGGAGGGAMEALAAIGLGAAVIALVRRRKRRDCCR